VYREIKPRNSFCFSVNFISALLLGKLTVYLIITVSFTASQEKNDGYFEHLSIDRRMRYDDSPYFSQGTQRRRGEGIFSPAVRWTAEE
jgi:hypothetical protein